MDKNDPSFGQPTFQALAAQETITLYNWWKKERPNRPDPSEASGWSEYCEERCNTAKARGDDLLWGNLLTNKGDEHSNTILSICRKIEKEQEDEDTAMLIHVIKIRQNLWT